MNIGLDYQTAKEKEAYKRLFTEILIRAFNDILPEKYYQFHLIQVLKFNYKRSRYLIEKHNSAIDWLLNYKQELCFEVLNLKHLSMDSVIKAISNKFNSQLKFQKFYTSYAGENKK